MSNPSSKPYRQHILERLKTPEDAGGYLAASLAENADCPEATGLVIQDIIAAFNLPLEVNTRVPVDRVAPGVDQQDNDEIRLALEGMIAAFDVSNYGDASVVATTRECALSIAKRAVGWTFASPAPKEEEAHRCPHCGRRMIGDFDEDVGIWYECTNCDYREAVSSTVTAAKPSGAAREAAEEIREWLGISGLVDGEGINEVAAIISRHSPAAAESSEQDELADEVQHRMDQVVEAAVEWHQAGREGGEWFEAAEKLGAAINSLLELRGTPPAPLASDRDPDT